MNLDGAVAVVTGGASGMGRATAEMVVRHGGHVAILDLPQSQGAAVTAVLGSQAVFLPTDVSDPAQVAAAFTAIARDLGQVTLAVNAAGFPGIRRFLRDSGEMFPLDLLRKIVAINLTGMFDVIRHSAASMRSAAPSADGERGVIINVASIAATEGKIGHAGYSASKGGVVAMTLPLARELAPLGIRVAAILPGSFDTGMMVTDPARRQHLLDAHLFPLRLGYPAEFALLVRAIAENPMLTGESIRLDAGARLT
jgi:3-hydroxyacyl-CoA dehydrogenase/3-hydroxy-2-methylbutyryl-CoA dehydrogenase